MSDINNLEEFVPFVSSAQIDAFRVFFELIERYNSKINLVSKSSISSAGSKHFADSVLGMDLIFKDLIDGEPLLDFGSGNGFPGIIASLLQPDWPVILVERDLRKSEFLKLAIDKLQLKNVQVHGGAVSELTQGSCFNVVSRAMAPLPKFLLEARPVMAVGGTAYMFKGDFWSTEFSAIPAQLFEHWDVELHSKYELPAGNGSRYIVRCTRE